MSFLTLQVDIVKSHSSGVLWASGASCSHVLLGVTTWRVTENSHQESTRKRSLFPFDSRPQSLSATHWGRLREVRKGCWMPGRAGFMAWNHPTQTGRKGLGVVEGEIPRVCEAEQGRLVSKEGREMSAYLGLQSEFGQCDRARTGHGGSSHSGWCPHSVLVQPMSANRAEACLCTQGLHRISNRLVLCCSLLPATAKTLKSSNCLNISSQTTFSVCLSVLACSVLTCIAAADERTAETKARAVTWSQAIIKAIVDEGDELPVFKRDLGVY